MESTLTTADWQILMEAREALASGTGAGIRIAVIDSGIEASHPALEGLILRDDVGVKQDGVQLQVVPGNGVDLFGHGTAIAGILRQMAPAAEIGSFQVLNNCLASRTAIIREGVRQAIERGYHILNCSFGCGVMDQIFQYKDWIDESYLKGIHVVSACNNTDYRKPEWPGYFTSVISVNMARTAETSAFFYKPGHLVEFAAAGAVKVRLPWAKGTFKEVTGSSFAAPRVAALLARLLSVMPELTPPEAKSLLRRLAEPWRDDFVDSLGT